MMNNYNILILVKSPSESERIINIFRQGDLPVRVHRITSNEDLNDHLNHDSWDIIIADNLHPEVSLPFCLDILKDKAPDLPLLLLSSDLSCDHKNQLIKLGVTDIIEKSEEHLFLHAAKRELIHSRIRQKNRVLQLSFDELQNRAEKLLSDSKECIAYIADGILINCNPSFAQLLGYDTNADLEYASFIDMVDDKDKGQFKQLLKLFVKNEQDFNQSALHIMKKGGESSSFNMSLQTTSFNHEPCIQVNLTMGENTTSNPKPASSNVTLQNLDALTQSVQLLTVSNSLQNHCFIIIAINDFADLRQELLITGCIAILEDLSCQLQSGNNNLSTYPLSSDTLLCLYPGTMDDGMDFLQSFFPSHESHIFEYNHASLTYTVNCAIIQAESHDLSSYIDLAAKTLYRMPAQNQNQATIITRESSSTPGIPSDSGTTKDLINNDNIEILYQPIMSLHGDKKENYEVTFKQQGEIDVLPLLTDSTLDRWLIIEATKALARHRESGHDTRLFINLSAFALKDETLPGWIKVALKASNLPIDSIIFQIDADDVKNDIKGAIHIFRSLKDNNQQLSLKNFNLSDKSSKILNHIKPQFICLTGEMTADMDNDSYLDELKTLLSNLADLNMESLVTNVANAGELAALWQLGVSYITGSYLQSPGNTMNFEFTALH